MYLQDKLCTFESKQYSKAGTTQADKHHNESKKVAERWGRGEKGLGFLPFTNVFAC